MSRGHEVACHGYTHRGYNALEPEERRESINRCREILDEFTGSRIVGHRTPRCRLSGRTYGLLGELSFAWNSDYMGAEECFYNIIDGRESRLLEIYVTHNLNDWAFFYDWGSTVRTVETWMVEFDAVYRERSLFCLTMHPQVTGWPSRLFASAGY